MLRSASHVVRLLVNKYPQYKIVNFDKLDYCASLKNIDDIAFAPNYRFIKGDICSSDLVNYVLRTEKIDTLVNFAAQTHVGTCLPPAPAFRACSQTGGFMLHYDCVPFLQTTRLATRSCSHKQTSLVHTCYLKALSLLS